MEKKLPPLGPFAIQKDSSCLFAMYADEGSLFCDVKDLALRQKADRDLILHYIAGFQLLPILMGNEKDGVLLFSSFDEGPWKEMFNWFLRCYSSLGISTVPRENLHFVEKERFYEKAQALLPEFERGVICAACHENNQLWSNGDRLEITQKVNSKMELVRNASAHGIPMPPSLVVQKKELISDKVNKFFNSHGPHVMVKLSGLGGATNVRRVTHPVQLGEFLEGFPDDTEVLLQQALDLDLWQEMTADFVVTDSKFALDNVRHVLLVNGKWLGNHLQKDISLSRRQKEALEGCLRWVQSEGFGHPEGWVCGIDFFTNGDELMVTEINGRWTGGFPIDKILKKLGIGDLDAYSFLDQVSPAKVQGFQAFIEEHLWKQGDRREFYLVPLAFCPGIGEEITEPLVIQLLVLGELSAFVEAKNSALGQQELPYANVLGSSELVQIL